MKTKKKTTQKERLLNEFKKGAKLTTYTASVHRLTTKLPTRIGEFEQEGYRFHKVWNTPKNVKAHYVYYLDKVKTPAKLLK